MPRGQFSPIVGLTDAERSDDPHAGDDNGIAGPVACWRHDHCPLLCSFDQRYAFAAPMSNARDGNLRYGSLVDRLNTRIVARGKQLSVLKCQCCERDIHHKLWLHAVADVSPCGPYRNVPKCSEPIALLTCGGLAPRCTGNDTKCL